MINIKHAKTEKCPGLSSLFITFNYRKEIVDIIKSCSVFIYNKENHIWEVPITELKNLIESLAILDDINIEFDYEDPKSKEIRNKCDITKYKTKPYKYQEEGINYGLNNNNWLLLDAPGLGKTLQVIYLAQELKEKENLEHCLVICGINTLKTNWKKEIEKHSNLTARILGERTNRKGNFVIDGVDKRVEQLMKPIDEFFVITNVELLRNDRSIKGILNGPNKFDMIVVDEIHTCFEYDTLIQTDKGLLKIGDIVTQDIDCCVYSYNHKRQKYEYKSLLAKYAYNTTKLLQLTFEENGITHTLTCTPDHKIFTKNRGYVCASELTSEDEFLLNNIV